MFELVPPGILRELVLPPSSLFCLLTVGIVLGRRYPRVGKALQIGAIALLFVLCTGFGARMLFAPLENLTTPLDQSHAVGAHAIVVLAAGRYGRAPEYGENEIPDYIALARLRYASKLHRELAIPLLASGGNGSADGQYKPKAIAMVRALNAEFATPVKWIETASENTQENAVFSAAILKQAKIGKVLLVTDAMHMPRAARAFRQAGLEVVEAPTIFFSASRVAAMDVLPSVENLRRSYYAIYEWLGLAWYRIRYGY